MSSFQLKYARQNLHDGFLYHHEYLTFVEGVSLFFSERRRFATNHPTNPPAFIRGRPWRWAGLGSKLRAWSQPKSSGQILVVRKISSLGTWAAPCFFPPNRWASSELCRPNRWEQGETWLFKMQPCFLVLCPLKQIHDSGAVTTR